MGRKIKFGIIGTGAIAQMHAAALQNLDNAELVAVFDKVETRAKDFADKYGVRYVTSFEEFLADPEVEAVTVATPTGVHGDVAIPAACAGKHILCEKPLDVTLEKADAIIRTCQEHNVRLSAVFQSRFVRSVQAIKKAYDAGRFGKVTLASTQVKWFRSQEYYDSAGWRGTWQLDGGGALMNQSIHTIDLLLYINGDAREVFAYSGILSHERIEVEDNLCAVVKYENGSMGTIEVSTSCAPGFPRRVEISGTNGSVVMEGDTIVRWEFVDSTPEDDQIRASCGESEGMQGGSGDPMAIGHGGHAKQIHDLAEAIIGGYDPMLSGKEGRRAVKFICGIYESCRTGVPYKFENSNFIWHL